MIERVLGHYTVLERIGTGGMGEVYRAHDQHLERDVALKLLPSGFLSDEMARKRFRREALALSKLNHPNIATVFDFDTQGSVDFLVMELIHGALLNDRLKADALPERDVLDLGIQLADGLAAAHAEGVIHRDLKPGNLMITPDGRLKILDFGLAVVRHQGDLDVTRTADTGGVAGTLPYMPPEQLRGQPTDARSDIYAAGAVLYEAATGHRPFPQTQSAELIGAVLHQSPVPPTELRRRMTPGLAAIVLKSLAKEPSQRFQSARDLLVALQATRAGAAQPQARRRAVALGIGVILTILVTSLLIALDVGGLRERLSLLRPAPIASTARRSVAVLGFKNLSGRAENAWLSTALSEMLTTELAAGERLRTIAGENVSQMKINLSLTDMETYGRDTLAKIRANLGTDVIVFGSYVPVADSQIRLDVRLQDAVAGETLTAFAERGSETQLDELARRVGSTLRQRLGVGELSASEAVTVKAAFPASPQAVRLYTEGLAKLRVFDALAARPLLEAAIALDPGYSLVSHPSIDGPKWS
jgi:TolB-like protein